MTTEKTKLLSGVILFISFVLLLALVWVVRNWHGVTLETPEEVVVETTPSLREVIRAEEVSGLVMPMSVTERSVLDRHFAALGGVNRISSITSFRMSGKGTFADGTEQDIVIIKKAGDRMRLTIKTPQMSRVMVVAPDANWVGLWNGGELLHVEKMSEAEISRQRHNAHVVSELYMALQNEWDLRYIGQRNFNYKMTHVFEVQTTPRHSIRFMIDPDTFLDIGQEERLFEEDGTLTITRRLNSGHTKVNGLNIPQKVEMFVNDVLMQTFEVESVQVNPGILDSIFAFPETPIKL